MTAGYWLRDHWPDTRNNFHSVTRSLKKIKKDYHGERGCVLLYIRINLLAFYDEWRSLNGYVTHSLFCCR